MMNLNKYLKYFLVSLICLFGSTLCYGQGLLSDLGQKTGTYTIKFEGERAMLSRDGSIATPITSGTCISQDGHYYLSVWHNEKLSITHFYLNNMELKTTYHVKQLDDIEEIFKKAADQYQTQLSIIIDHDQFTNEQIDTQLAVLIERLRQKYPMYLVDSRGSYYQIIRKKGYIQLEIYFAYPLKKSVLENYEKEAHIWIHQQLTHNLTSTMKDYDIENSMMQLVMQYLSYSEQKESLDATSLSHTVIGAIKDKTAVCDGYSKLLMYLLNASGVPTQLVIGNVKDGDQDVGHAWNLVEIAGQYYHVDTTFSDAETQLKGLPLYFNETDAVMEEDHIWEKAAYPKATEEAFTGAYIPCEQKSVYRASNAKSLARTYQQMEKDRSPGTLILQNLSQNKWNEEEVLKQLTHIYHKVFHYHVLQKYDAIMIWFY